MTYWNDKGLYQEQADKLTQLIPSAGEVPDAKGSNKHLDAYRRAVNCYYDLYNNGLCNRAREFRSLFGITGSPSEINMIENKMDQFILAAYKEQFSEEHTA